MVFTRGAVPLIVRDPPDFIYQRYARFGWAGVVASLRTGRPLFLEYNGSEVWVGRHWDHVGMLDLLERYERLNLKAAARIFVVSNVERRNLQSAGVAPEKIVVNPNGVDPEVFRPGIGGDRVRDQLGVHGETTLVGFVGSFGPWHGVLALAEAIKSIPSTTPLLFVLVGTGSLHGEVKQLLAAEEEQGRVIFTGAINHNEVPVLLDACDVLVSPHIPLADGSDFFGSPTKIFEYMAMGKGIVASRLGQIGEVLTDGVSALLVEPGDVDELSAALVRLAESPALRQHLGAAARQAAIERHTWKRNAQNVLDTYRDWLERGR
jgi:glycosyltransferase involved in cell wall biosynthesis